MPTFDTTGPITAHIDVASGEVRVRAGEHDDTTVAVRPSDPDNARDREAAERTVIERDGQQVSVRTPKLGLLTGKGGSVDVTAAVPAGSKLRGSGQTADFTAEGRLGECRLTLGLGSIRLGEAGDVALKCGLGDIAIERVTGHASITAGSGDVRIDAAVRGATVKNANGDTWIGAVDGDAQVKSANGDIAVEQLGGAATLKTSNGDVRVGRTGHGDVDVQTAAGDLEVGIPAGTAAFLDVNASYGRVHNQLTPSNVPGDGPKLEVRARTTAGNITIRRPAGSPA